MLTVTGIMCPIMATYGFLPQTPTGRRIAMAAGYMSPAWNGPGFPTSHGVGRHTTMGAGSFMAEIGVGGRDLSIVDMNRSGRRLMFPSSDLAAGVGELALDLAAGLAT